ncbi:MAG: amidohydrolase family protein, partial [Ferruginibacter sp.]
DEDLVSYDTNLKLNPPLRTVSDRAALREAVENGLVDCIATHHLPQNWDNKICEFENAGYGMIGLETVFSVVMSTGCTVERFVEMKTINNRNIFGLPLPSLSQGAKACLTLFNSNEPWVLEENKIVSKSKNSPFIGKAFKGKVIGIINGDKIVLNS